MSDFAESLFSDMVEDEEPKPEEYYPGSKKKIPRRPQVAPPPAAKAWDRNPRLLKVNGVEMEFFTIGALAEAINRKPVTIRSWEDKGILPQARFRTPSIGDQAGRRLYTRKQVEGLVLLCAKYQILTFASRPDSIPKGFTSEVIDLWMES